MDRMFGEAAAASNDATVARRGATERANFFAPSTAWRRGTDRLLEVAPFLTTLLLLSVYPLLRYLLRDPFPAELFRFLFICFWVGFLIVNMVRAHKTRQAILQNLEIDWLDRVRSLDLPLSHYAIFMPLKHEGNRHVLFQTFRSVERLSYPRSLVTLVPIVEADDTLTLEKLGEVL